MAEAREPGGPGSGSFRPFDRQALQDTLADALKDADAPFSGDVPAAGAAVAAPPTITPQAAAAAGPTAAPAPTAGPSPTAAPAPKLNPFGRTGPVGGPASPGPARITPAATGPTPINPGPARAVPVPGAASAGPGAGAPRTGPSILSGGLANALSPLNPTPGGLGGGSISGLRAPGSAGGPAGPAQGLGPRPLPGISGLGAGSVIDEPVEEATIALRRPAPPEPVRESAPEPAAPAAPPRPSVPVAAWLPSDDDILPRGTHKRKGRRRR